MNIEYIDTKDFELGWRWTQESHRLIPKEDLINIKPFSESSSRWLYKQKPNLSGNSKEIECIKTPTNFLTMNLGNEKVYVFWSKEIGVEMDTKTLIKYFSDFCYPSSDDVIIWPISNSWLLQYHHYELLTLVKQ